MTADVSQPRQLARRRSARRRVLPVVAATGVWIVSLAGLAPAAVAEDVQSRQWYLDAMQAEEMWKVSTGEGIKVAVVDTGVDPDTTSLKGQVLPGRDLSGGSGDENDDYSGHGTSMAELIAGTGDGGGVQGLAPGAKIIPIRTSLIGQEGVEDVDKSYEGIRAAADSEARIINLSFAGYLSHHQLKSAVKYAVGKGKLVFAGAGNDGKNDIGYPAGYPGAVGVGSVDSSAKVSKFSNSGRHVSLTAPGEDMPGWCGKALEKYCDEGGTSNAAAIASASAALIWSEHPDWTANQVLRVMIETASKPKDGKVPSTHLGYGVVRPNRVLLKGEGDPGAPGQNPLSPAEPSKSPAPSQSSEDKNGEKNAADKVEVADSTESDDDSQLWIILGTGAAVAVLAAGAFAFVRKRRT